MQFGRAEQTAAVMRQRPDVCGYLGRALVEGTPGSSGLFRLMIAGGRAEIDSLAQKGALRDDADRLWATLQHFFLIWAPLSFRALLEREALDGSLLEPQNPGALGGGERAAVGGGALPRCLSGSRS
jgi:hypothetical protein